MIRTLTIALLATLGTLGTPLGAQEYQIDTTHSSLIWGIQHLGLGNTYGRFNDFAGTVRFDRADLDNSSVEIEVQVASIDSNSQKRDDHLRNADFFDAGTYPTITFSATGFRPADEPDTWIVPGEITIRGETRPLEATVRLIGQGTHAMAKKPAVGFESEFVLDRTDFGVGQGGVSKVVGEEVEVLVAIEAIAE